MERQSMTFWKISKWESIWNNQQKQLTACMNVSNVLKIEKTALTLKLYIVFSLKINKCLLHFRFAIFLKCWQFDPEERPTFAELKCLLSNLSGEISRQCTD